MVVALFEAGCRRRSACYAKGMLGPKFISAAVLSAWITVSGCASVQPSPPAAAPAPTQRAAEASGNELPAYLAELGITGQQRAALDKIRDDLVARLARADVQRLAFQDSMVDAIASCDPAFARLHIEGQRMVREGNLAKPVVLDAVNQLHALLRPEQRRKLVEPLIDRNRERRGSDGASGFEEFGKTLDLSISQILQLVKRAKTHISLDGNARDALRDQFDEAAKAFMLDSFDAHQTAFGREPLVELAVRLVLDLGTVVLPVLDPTQCTNVAKFARERFDEAERKRAERRAAQAAARASADGDTNAAPNDHPRRVTEAAQREPGAGEPGDGTSSALESRAK